MRLVAPVGRLRRRADLVHALQQRREQLWLRFLLVNALRFISAHVEEAALLTGELIAIFALRQAMSGRVREDRALMVAYPDLLAPVQTIRMTWHQSMNSMARGGQAREKSSGKAALPPD